MTPWGWHLFAETCRSWCVINGFPNAYLLYNIFIISKCTIRKTQKYLQSSSVKEQTNRHNFIKFSFTFEETNILSDIRNLKFKEVFDFSVFWMWHSSPEFHTWWRISWQGDHLSAANMCLFRTDLVKQFIATSWESTPLNKWSIFPPVLSPSVSLYNLPEATMKNSTISDTPLCFIA